MAYFTISDNKQFTLDDFYFLRDVYNASGYHLQDSDVLNDLLNPSKSFVQFNYNGIAYNALCPWHQDHHMGGKLGSKSSSVTQFRNGLGCWACQQIGKHRIIDLYSLTHFAPVTRVPRAGDDVAQIETMNKWAKFIQAVDMVGGWDTLINSALKNRHDLQEKYADVFNPNYKKLSNESKLVLEINNALVNSHLGTDKAVQYITSRGFSVDFAKSLQPLYFGATQEEVIENLSVLLMPLIERNNNATDSTKGFVLRYLTEMGYFQLNKVTNYVYSCFTNRIIIPIYDADGNIVNFNMRSLDPNEKAKYLYLKTNVTDQAVQSAINELGVNNSDHLANIQYTGHDQVYVTEGYYDMLALKANHLSTVCGFSNKLTKKQMQDAMYRFKTIILAYDNDGPGIQGAFDTAENFLDYGVICAMMVPPKTINKIVVKDWNDAEKIFFNSLLPLMNGKTTSEIYTLVDTYKYSIMMHRTPKNIAEKPQKTFLEDLWIELNNDFNRQTAHYVSYPKFYLAIQLAKIYQLTHKDAHWPYDELSIVENKKTVAQQTSDIMTEINRKLLKMTNALVPQFVKLDTNATEAKTDKLSSLFATNNEILVSTITNFKLLITAHKAEFNDGVAEMLLHSFSLEFLNQLVYTNILKNMQHLNVYEIAKFLQVRLDTLKAENDQQNYNGQEKFFSKAYEANKVFLDPKTRDKNLKDYSAINDLKNSSTHEGWIPKRLHR